MMKIFFILISLTLPTISFAQEGYQPLAPININGINITQGTSLAQYLGTIFSIMIAAAAILAVIMITIGGLQYMTSDAIGGKEGAKNRMKYAIFGLLLALGSYLILHTINPNILKTQFLVKNVGVKDPDQIKTIGDFIGKGLAENESWYQDPTLAKIAKEDPEDFESVLNAEMYKDGNTKMREELLYTLIDALERQESGEIVDPEIINAIRDSETAKGIYERAIRIIEARKKIEDVLNNEKFNPTTASDRIFKDKEAFKTLFEENDLIGLYDIAIDNHSLNGDNTFVNGLSKLTDYKYLEKDGGLDKDIASIYNIINSRSNHTVDQNNKYSVLEGSLYNILKKTTENLNKGDFSAPPNPDGPTLSEQEELEKERREAYDEGQQPNTRSEEIDASLNNDSVFDVNILP